MTTLIVDGDTIVYQVAAECEGAYDWGNGVYSVTADLDEAKGKVLDRIRGLKKDTSADRVVVALKGAGNFRMAILPTYKKNRAANKPPILRMALMNWLKASKPKAVYSRPLLEADDVVGILATHPTLIPGEKLIWSIDKDLMQVPGSHVVPTSSVGGLALKTMTPLECAYWHMTQTLTGDAVDGYGGCPKVGPVKAGRILAETEGDPLRMWRAVEEAYLDAGLTIQHALVMAQVARICIFTDYDYKKKEPIPWMSPVA